MKDIKWLKEKIWKQDIVMDKGYIYTDDLMSIINEVDKQEVLSEKWIDKYSYNIEEYWQIADMMSEPQYVVPIEKL